MLAHNYSQLAVIKDGLQGVITLESLALNDAQSLQNYEPEGDQSPSKNLVKHFVSTAPPIIDAKADILSAVPIIERHGYALIKDEDSYGIATVYDLMKFYQRSGNLLTMIQEFEETLQRSLEESGFTDGDVRRPITLARSLNTMTLGAYPYIFKLEEAQEGEDDNSKAKRDERNRKRADNWARLKWTTLDQDYVVELFERVAEVRNNLAHWHADEVTEDDVIVVNAALRLIRLATRSEPEGDDSDNEDNGV